MCRVMAGTLTWTPVVGQGWLSIWEMQLHLSRLRSTWSTFFGILFVLSPHSGLLRCVLFHLSKYCTAFLPHRSEHVFHERVFFHLSLSRPRRYIFLFAALIPHLWISKLSILLNEFKERLLVCVAVHLKYYHKLREDTSWWIIVMV